MGIQINGQTDTVTAIDGSLNVGGDVTIPGVLTYDDVTNVDSIGIVTARSGVHVTSGSVGIGTDNPVTKLNIVGSTASASSSGGTLGIRQKGNTYNDGITLTSSHANSARFYKDSDGKLHIFNTGTGSNQFVLDNAGNVGIGTDGPAGKLHLSSGESGDCALIIEADTDNNEETDNPYIEFRQDGGMRQSAVGLDDNRLVLSNSVNAGKGIIFKVGSTNNDWENAPERVSIGTSETVCTGFYRATNIPYMRATTTPTVAFGVGTVVNSFGSVQQNSNFNSYDNSTGEYTCPVNGLYLASAAITGTNTPSSATNSLAWLQQQGSGSVNYGSNYREAHVTCSMSGVFNCLAGDTITVRTTNITIMSSSPRNYFTVALLG